MQRPTVAFRRESDIPRTLQRVERGPSVLALDYDGTVAPFRTDRSTAVPAPELVLALTALARSPATRLVIVSGRPIAEIERLIGVDPLPELFGVHGWEHRLPGGERRDTAVAPAAAAAFAAEYERLAGDGIAERVERKSASLALHWRGLGTAQASQLQRAVEAPWRRLAEQHAMELRPFNAGLELLLRGRSKGDVVRELLGGETAQPALAYLGDDGTDEDAFRALPDGGLGVLVASERRPTSARVTIGMGEVGAFLDAWLHAAERRGG